MSKQRNDDWIERWLRDDARRPLPDGGFTDRLMRELPGRRTTQAWLRPALILGSTVLGSALAAALSPVGPMVLAGLAELGHFRGFTPELNAVLAMAAVLAVSGYVLATDE